MLNILLLWSCGGEKEIVCTPKHLVEMSSCSGEDNSSTECRYYHQAIGKPDPMWCRQIKENASQKNQMMACNFTDATSMISLPCTAYGFEQQLSCYGCIVSEPNASQTYIFAYNADCSEAIEQVTCNVSPLKMPKIKP